VTNKPTRVRILMMPHQDSAGIDPVAYTGPATVLTGLPRTIRRHELLLIVPLADSTIYEMERRGDFPRRFNLSPRCVVGTWKKWKCGWSSAAKSILKVAQRSLPHQTFTNATTVPSSAAMV
jgi:Prophage CP4-57 regulatory protein (AlpA)